MKGTWADHLSDHQGEWGEGLNRHQLRPYSDHQQAGLPESAILEVCQKSSYSLNSPPSQSKKQTVSVALP